MKFKNSKSFSLASKQNRRQVAIICGIISFLVLFMMPKLGLKNYWIRTLTFCMIYSCVASAWNVIAGYAGVFSFGFQSFFGIGAYVSAILSMNLGMSPWLTMWIGAFIAMLLGMVIAIPSLKLRETPYICIATMCMGELVRIVITNTPNLTRGELGLSNIPKFFAAKTNLISCYYLMLFLLTATVLLITLIVNSPMGMSLRAMKDSQDASESLGINVSRTKLVIYMIGAFIAGVVGAFYAHYLNILTPSSVIGTSVMTQFVAMCLLGGIGTIVGPILGSFTITLGLEFLRGASDYRMIFYALLIIVSVIFLRNGIWGTIKEYMVSLSVRRSARNHIE